MLAETRENSEGMRYQARHKKKVLPFVQKAA